jgi:hypothetical protein
MHLFADLFNIIITYICIYVYYNRLNIIYLRIFKCIYFIYLESKIIIIIYAYSFIAHLMSVNHTENVSTIKQETITELEPRSTVVIR